MTTLPVITGPTASGKGAVAFELAVLGNGELVSLDSMKVYREIDIITAKPPAARRSRIPHHLLDIVDPHEEFSIAEYLPLLERTVTAIHARGHRAIISGGTALYLKALLHGFRSGPPADWELRERLKAEAEEHGVPALHERLRRLDSEAAEVIDPNDLRRVVRALEVHEKTGEPISAEWSWSAKTSDTPCTFRVFGLEWERDELYRRINLRVERMVEAGMFAEIERLSTRQPPLSRTAAQSIGYKEAIEGVRNGLSHAAIVQEVQQSTRRFAKRQLTWFRKLPIEWIAVSGGDSAEGIAREIYGRLGW